MCVYNCRQSKLSQRVCDILYSMLTNWKQIFDCLYILKCFLPTYPQKSQELSWTHGKFQVEPFLSYPWVKGEKGGEKNQHMEWEFEFVIKEEKTYFVLCLSLSYLTMADRTLPKFFNVFQREETHLCAKAKYERIQRVLSTQVCTREFLRQIYV